MLSSVAHSFITLGPEEVREEVAFSIRGGAKWH